MTFLTLARIDHRELSALTRTVDVVIDHALKAARDFMGRLVLQRNSVGRRPKGARGKGNIRDLRPRAVFADSTIHTYV